MPNNLNALPATGPLSLEDISNAFYLYKAYADGYTTAIDDYYGDLIRYYSPLTPKIPTTIDRKINIDVFHGKRYGLPIPLVINSPVNNYNVYDQAAAYAQTTYGLQLNTPGIPFFITVTNNSSVGSAVITAPLTNTSTINFTTRGVYSWRVPVGVGSVNIVVVGAGGQGSPSTSQLSDLSLICGGGGGGQVITQNNVTVTPGTSIHIGVGVGGTGGPSTEGTPGGSSAFGAYVAQGGLGGTPTSGGAAGGAGGTAGGKGSPGVKGGTTLAAPFGVGGNGVTNTTGADGAVLITYGTAGATTRNTQNTAAMIIGTSADGSKTFNTLTTCLLVNKGSITGKADTTPVRAGLGSPFTVSENQATVQYDVAGGGGGGGSGGAWDSGNAKTGGQGGGGNRVSGSMPVKNGDVVSFGGGGGGGAGSSGGTGAIYKNGATYAAAGGGGAGGNQNGQTGSPNYSGGGSGGGGGAYADGNNAATRRIGGRGSGGWASVSYQPNLPGGPAIYITKSTSVDNTGVISGGSTSIGTIGGGYAVIGKSSIIGGGIGGKVNGVLI